MENFGDKGVVALIIKWAEIVANSKMYDIIKICNERNENNMKMEFIFDKDKLKKEGYDEEQCLNAIRRHFQEYNSKTIKETRKGFFEGSEDDWNAFGATARFPYTTWFLKVIKEWYWYVDEGDGLGEQKEDCLQSYYEVKAVNA